MDEYPGISYLEEKAKEEIAYEIARKKRDQELEVQRIKEAELLRKQEAEEKRLKQLLEDCERWHQAKRLREYIFEAKAHTTSHNSSTRDFFNWLEWANNKADEMDPCR